MVARSLKILLLVQLLVMAGLAWHAVRAWNLAWPAAVLFGVDVVVSLRLFVTTQNFLLSWFYRSPTPAAYRLGLVQRCRLLAYEFASTMLASSLTMAWPGPAMSLASRQDAASARLPVLLIHGYGCNHGYWRKLATRLELEGISNYAVDLEPVTAGIDDYVPAVTRAVEQLCAATGSAKLIIVGHSMGGLVARAYLRSHGASRVARVITLGTPHHGTGLASFGLGRNAAQMRVLAREDHIGPGAINPAQQEKAAHAQVNNARVAKRPAAEAGQPWLGTLAACESGDCRGLITSIFTHHDNIVAPQLSSVLPGAKNIAFGGIGHVALGRHPAIVDCVLEELALAAVPATGEWPVQAERA
jgi:pimeloyl-ACP methyl ester carboxylesterase